MKSLITIKDWKYNIPGSFLTSYDVGGYVLFFDKGNDSIANKFNEKWMKINNTLNNIVIKDINF